MASKKKWIPKNLKKGRCAPAPNPDCPVGSPQYNLAQTFKKHHGFHKKEFGGKMSFDGYKTTSKDKNEDSLIIPSDYITTEGMAFPIVANGIVLHPNTGDYKFNGPVHERPLHKRKSGGQISKNWLVGSEDGRMVAQAGASMPLEKDFVDPMAYHAALDAYMEQMRQGLSVPQVMQNKDLSKPAEMFGGTRNLEPLKDRLQTYTPPTGIQYTPSPNPFPNRDLSKPASMSPQKDKNRVNWGNTVLDALLMADVLIPGDKIKDPVVRPGLSYNEHQYGTGSQAIAKHGKELPCLDCGGRMKKAQAGGLLAANMEAKRFAKARGLISGEDTHVDQIPEYIDSATGKPTKPAFVKPKAYTVPNDIQLSDIQTDGSMYWYAHPKTGDIIDVDPSVVNLPRFRKMQAGGTMPGMTGQIYAKYAQAVSKYANKMEAGGDMPYNELLVHSEGNMHKKIAKYKSGGELTTLYEEGGTYEMDDNEIKRLVSMGYTLKIK